MRGQGTCSFAGSGALWRKVANRVICRSHDARREQLRKLAYLALAGCVMRDYLKVSIKSGADALANLRNPRKVVSRQGDVANDRQRNGSQACQPFSKIEFVASEKTVGTDISVGGTGMQLTPAAFELIRDLRGDAYVREHFSMMSWMNIDAPCGTIGCIAGTALMQKGVDIHRMQNAMIVKRAADHLGIDYLDVAKQLFQPWHWSAVVEKAFPDLNENARPSANRLVKMRTFNQRHIRPNIVGFPSSPGEIERDFAYAWSVVQSRDPRLFLTADAAANALERLQDHETFVDWAEAHHLETA